MCPLNVLDWPFSNTKKWNILYILHIMKRTKCHFIPTVGFTYKGNEMTMYLTG